MNKTSKSKAGVCGCDAWPERCTHTSPRPTDIVTRMEAAQQRFGRLQLNDRADWIQPGDPPAFDGESEADYNERTGRYDEHMVEGTLSDFGDI